MSIPLEIFYSEEISGWEGQAKGSFQVTWERGLTNVNNIYVCNVRGKKAKYVTLDKKGSLCHILAQCADLANETTLLQGTLSKQDVEVIWTPTFNTELAGEGIEYS